MPQSDRAKAPPAIAKHYAVGVGTVLGWIRSGELAAINVGSGAKRPRWRIMPDALEAFERRRAAQPATKPARRRRKADPAVIEFF
jgi:hypothetical protein